MVYSRCLIRHKMRGVKGDGSKQEDTVRDSYLDGYRVALLAKHVHQIFAVAVLR